MLEFSPLVHKKKLNETLCFNFYLTLCRVNEQKPGDTCDRPEIGPDDPQPDALSVGESLNIDQPPSTDKTGRS